MSKPTITINQKLDDSQGDVVKVSLLPDQNSAHRYMTALLEALSALPEGESLSDDQMAKLWSEAHQ